MAREKTVQVSFGVEHARYAIGDTGADGTMETVGDAIDRFTNGRGLETGLVARVDGAEADFDATLRDGDVIMIATEQSATGGYKGA